MRASAISIAASFSSRACSLATNTFCLSAIAAWSARADEQAVDCLVPAGGAVVMRPLLLHAPAAGTGPGRRRVIHLEYAAFALPGGLEWYDDRVDAEVGQTQARRAP